MIAVMMPQLTKVILLVVSVLAPSGETVKLESAKPYPTMEACLGDMPDKLAKLTEHGYIPVTAECKAVERPVA